MIANLEVNDDIVLCGHVIGDVVVQNETKQTIQQSEIHFLEDLGELSFQENQALAW